MNSKNIFNEVGWVIVGGYAEGGKKDATNLLVWCSNGVWSFVENEIGKVFEDKLEAEEKLEKMNIPKGVAAVVRIDLLEFWIPPS